MQLLGLDNCILHTVKRVLYFLKDYLAANSRQEQHLCDQTLGGFFCILNHYDGMKKRNYICNKLICI